MRLLLLSDWHVDYNAEKCGVSEEQLLKGIVSTISEVAHEMNVDYIINAGDIGTTPENVHFLLSKLRDKNIMSPEIYEKFIYTPGNHDLWMDDSDKHFERHYNNKYFDNLLANKDKFLLNEDEERYFDNYEQIKSSSKIKNENYFYSELYAKTLVRNSFDAYLKINNSHPCCIGSSKYENRYFSHNNWRIFGETCWYDIDELVVPTWEHAKWGFNPFYEMMGCLEKYLKYNRNNRSNKLLVTHYVPFWECIHPKYAGDSNNKYFCVPMIGDLARNYGIDVIVYGHTHVKQSIVADGVKTYCAPLGYCNEWRGGNLHDAVLNALMVVDV